MKLRGFLLGLVSIATLGLALPLQGAIVPAPGITDKKYTQAEYDANYDLGYANGQKDMQIQCKGDPASCDIRMSDVLTGAEYGETEPNDHIVAADPMVPEHKYWGQSYGLLDKDWYFFTTNEPNQIVTLDFTVPFRDTASNVSDWIVQVRDAAGNIYAEFSTSFIAGNTNGDNEIVYPVFLGHVGTYYIVVQPEGGPGKVVSFYPYNVAIALEYSGMDGTPWDVNFYDVETEPNNTPEQADPIASGVSVYGMLHTTLQQIKIENDVSTGADDAFVARYVQAEEDWFVYQSIGNEGISLAICGREACAEGTWFIDVQDGAGATILSFNTKTPQVVRFGLANAGSYFMNVGFQKMAEAECATSHKENQCIASEWVCNKGEKPQCSSGTLEGDQCCTTTTTCTGTPPVCTDKKDCVAANEVACDDPLSGNDPSCKLNTEAKCGVDDPAWTEVCNKYGEVEGCDTWAPTQNENALDVEYNFNWHGTKLPPHTADTPAYEEFLERPAWYQGP